MFEKFSHQITTPYIWIFILLIALRAEYSCIRKKEYVHASAFLAVIIISLYFILSMYGLLPHGFEEELFSI